MLTGGSGMTQGGVRPSLEHSEPALWESHLVGTP